MESNKDKEFKLDFDKWNLGDTSFGFGIDSQDDLDEENDDNKEMNFEQMVQVLTQKQDKETQQRNQRLSEVSRNVTSAQQVTQKQTIDAQSMLN